MKKYIDLLKQINKTLIVLILISFVFWVILLIVAIPKTIFTFEIIFISLVFVLNTIMIAYSYTKDKVIPYVLALNIILSEILLLIFILMTKV